MRNANGVDREGALAACELLTGASPEEIEALAACAAAWEAPKGAGIFAEREPARGLWILAAGRVKLQHGTPAGREQLVDFADAPCALDVCSFLDGLPLTTSAVAVTDVTVLLVPRDAVLALLERRRQLVWPLVQQVCRDLRRAELDAASVALKEAPERLACRMVRLGRRYGQQPNSGAIVIDENVTRQDLASSVGVVIETAIRIISDWRRAGLVLTEGRAIELCDIPRMRQIAGCDGCLFECP